VLTDLPAVSCRTQRLSRLSTEAVENVPAILGLAETGRGRRRIGEMDAGDQARMASISDPVPRIAIIRVTF
jgi:hypothetical protein